jgi:putative ABC transport system permease protein
VLQGRLILQGHEEQRLQLMGIEPVSLPAGAAVAGQALAIEQIVGFYGTGQHLDFAADFAGPGVERRGAPARGKWSDTAALARARRHGPGVLLVDIGFAQQILGLPDQLSRLLLPKGFTATLPEALKGNFSSRPLAKKTTSPA